MGRRLTNHTPQDRSSAGSQPRTRIVRADEILLGAEQRAVRPSRLAQVVGWFTAVSTAALVMVLAFWLLLALVGGR